MHFFKMRIKKKNTYIIKHTELKKKKEEQKKNLS